MGHEYQIRLVLFRIANWNLLRSELIRFVGSLNSLLCGSF